MINKVLIIGPAWPLRGGLSTFDQLLASEFLAKGIQTEILSFSLQYPGFLFPGKTQYSSDPAPTGLKIFPEINSINPFNWVSTGNKFRNRNYDLVIIRYWMPFMGPCLGTIAKMISKNKKTRVVSITDNIYPHEKRFFDKPFTKYFLKNCHGFLAMSKEVLSHISDFEKDKPRFFNPHPMYTGFGPALEKTDACSNLGLNPNENHILFFGFIRAYKGLDILLQALASEKLKNLDFKVIIAGEFYENSQSYLDMIHSLGIGEKLILRTEFIPDSEVRNYFSICDLVVQPYKSATQSGVTQIAYFYDKPMLVTNVGGLPELVENGKCGYVVSPNSEEIAESLLDFYQNNRAHKMAEEVRKAKSRFTWDSLIENIKKAGGI